MALPHPHGTASGQIGNGVQIDLNDAPGSTGGRFVGFGEDGKSKSNNRGLWALSENIDYIYQNYTAYRTVPGVKTFTSGGSDYYNLTEWTFVGLSTYPASESIGLPLMFSVLDERWASLGDPEQGGEVRVSSVRDTGNVGTVYKGGDAKGFYQNVRLGFSLIDAPTGTVLVENYSIPEGTVVNIVYGARGNYESLASDALLRVMLNKTGVPAGVILQNGTRPMLADLDVNGYKLLHVLGLEGGVTPLYIKDLTAPNENKFSEPIYGTGLTSEVPAAHVSILGKINSALKGVGHALPNRFITKFGDLTFDGTEGTVALPAMNEYLMGNETFYTTEELVVQLPWDDQTYYIVLDHTSGTPVLTAISANSMDDFTPYMVLVGWGNVSSSVYEFNGYGDLRMTGRHVGSRFEVYVGSDPQCDFSDLKMAIDFVYANYLCLPSTGTTSWRPRIVVRGELHVPEVLQTVTFPYPTPFAWELVGEGTGNATVAGRYAGQAIIWGATGINQPTINANYNVIHLKRLAFVAGSGTTGAKAITTLGFGSTLTECSFVAPTYGASLIAAVEQPTGYEGELMFKSCFFSAIAGPAVVAYGTTLFEDCTFSTVAASAGANMNTTGGNTTYHRCTLKNEAGAVVSASLDSATTQQNGHLDVDGCTFIGAGLKIVYPLTAKSGQISVRNNIFQDVTYTDLSAIKADNSAGSITSGTPTGAVHLQIEGNVFEGCTTSIDLNMSRVETDYNNVSVRDNNIRPAYAGSTLLEKGMIFTDCGRFTVSGNTITKCRYGITVSRYAGGTISSNHFRDCTLRGVDILAGYNPVVVQENTFMLDGVDGTNFVRITDNEKCSLINNVLKRASHTLATAFYLSAAHRTLIQGNKICSTTGDSIYVSASSFVRIIGNDMGGTVTGSCAIDLLNSTGYWVCDNLIEPIPSEGATVVVGGGIYARRTSDGLSYGTISGNRFTKVNGYGQFSAEGSNFIIYFEQNSNETLMGRTIVEKNVLDTCGDTAPGNNAYISYIYGQGVCQVCYNVIIDPQWSTDGTDTIQHGISIQMEVPAVWSSIVHGNQILVNNAADSAGGIVPHGAFVGILMNQHGSVMGNTIVALNLVPSESGGSRIAISVGSGRNVTDVGNISKNIGTNINIVQGMTVGNVGDVNTNGNLSDHATGNTTGA